MKISTKLLLGFDNVKIFGINSFSQTFPLLLIPALLSFRLRDKIKRVVFLEFIMLLYGVVVSTFYFLQSGDYALQGLIRQSSSYALGIIMFSYLLRSFDPSNQANIISWVNQLVYLLSIFVFMQLLFSGERPTGLSSEPSHVGDMIGLLLLPLLLLTRSKNPHFWLALFLLIVSLLSTQSLTSYLKVITLLVVITILLRPLFVLPLVAGVVFAIYIALNSHVDNYALNILKNDFNALMALNVLSLSGSFIDRFGGLVVLFTVDFSFERLFGGGFGCELSCFFPFLDAELADVIKGVKSFPPTLSPYFVKFSFYFGLIPSFLLLNFYLLLIYRKWKVISRLEISILLSLFTASLYSIGPFWLPYIWFWKAYLVKK